MRVSRLLLSAGVETVAAPVEKAVTKSASASKPSRGFSPLPLHAWQKHCLGVSGAELLPSSLLYHGTNLGPRPLIILDHTTSRAPTGAGNISSSSSDEDAMVRLAASSKKYEPMLSQLSWEYGAVYIPLSVDYMDTAQDVVEHSCRQIAAVMDALDVRWTHFLTYSYGSLVAARMAASDAFPHRIGTFTVLDTPLLTRELVRNMEQREEIAKAERDVNVPRAELAFAKETLLSSLEAPLPCPAEADAALYAEYLFHPNSIFRRDGLTRLETRYVPVRALAEVRHPLQVIVPAAGAMVDVGVHKDVFGLRRPAVIKGCQRHEDLFTEKAAGEVAVAMDSWLHRFEPDTFIARRYEQAAKEMEQLMTAAQPTPQREGAATETGDQRKKKKEKKKQKA